MDANYSTPLSQVVLTTNGRALNLLLRLCLWESGISPTTSCSGVLVGLPLEDHRAAASVCTSFRDVITGPRFLALRAVRPAELQIAIVASVAIDGQANDNSRIAWRPERRHGKHSDRRGLHLAGRRPIAVPGCLSAPSNRAPLPVNLWRWTSRPGDGDPSQPCPGISASLHGVAWWTPRMSQGHTRAWAQPLS